MPRCACSKTVGIERAVSYAKTLGVGTVPNVPSLALGSGEVTLASMTAAYAAFAHGGIVHDPIFIRRVEDQDGSMLFQSDSQPRRAVSESTAFLMATMLADVVDAGTANRARAMGFTLPAAGKTGTTNDFVDAWFVGFTPKLVAGVWVGFDTPRTIVKNGFAGQLAVPMWTQFMKAATKRRSPRSGSSRRATSSRVEVCRLSGALPGAGMPQRRVDQPDRARSRASRWSYTDYFVRGTEPQHTCADARRRLRAVSGAGTLRCRRSTVSEAVLAGTCGTADPVPAAAPPASREPERQSTASELPPTPRSPRRRLPKPAPASEPDYH